MKKTLLATVIFGAISLLSNCTDTTSNKTTESKKDISQKDMALGFSLMNTNCFSCHSPDASMENRIAPPMAAIKKHYISNKTTEAQFVKELTAFIKNPSKENTKMPDAVKKFGVMPKMDFDEAQLKAIATYIYHTDLQEPSWFKEHFAEEQKRYEQDLNAADKTYLQRGKEYAMATKAVLGKNLLSAINSKGTEDALSFCNERAIPLTDSMQTSLGVNIKRASDNNRNPDNAATLDELEYILQSKKMLDNGQELKPQIHEKGNKMVGYYPILSNQMCLQCHGKPNDDIQLKTIKKIDKLYPNDKAKGYGVNELRGIWVIEMPKD